MKNALLLFFALCTAVAASAQSKPVLVSHTPVTGASSVLTTIPITMSFSKPVIKGTGNIYLKNRHLQTTNTIPVSAANVSVSGSFVTISSLNLLSGTTYHVTFDSAAFDSAGYRSVGLYDTSGWWFKTSGNAAGVSNVATALPARLITPGANGLFIFSLELPEAAIITVRIFDLNGRAVLNRSLSVSQGDNQVPLQTSLQPGTYLIHIDDGKKSCSIKATMH